MTFSPRNPATSLRDASGPPRTLLTTSSNGPARLWDLDADRLTDRACADAANRITANEWADHVPELPYDPPSD